MQSDGSLWAWGSNNYGQLGLGDTIKRDIPTRVGTDNDWVSVDVGVYHSLALKSDGSLWAWGYNKYGRLGLRDTIDRDVPTCVWKVSGKSFGREIFTLLGLLATMDLYALYKLLKTKKWSTPV